MERRDSIFCAAVVPALSRTQTASAVQNSLSQTFYPAIPRNAGAKCVSPFFGRLSSLVYYLRFSNNTISVYNKLKSQMHFYIFNYNN